MLAAAGNYTRARTCPVRIQVGEPGRTSNPHGSKWRT